MQATGQPSILSGLRTGLDYPLLFDPGTRWDYGIGIDWLGQVAEKVDGRTTNDVAGLVMTQTLPFVEPRFMGVYEAFEKGVYSALAR